MRILLVVALGALFLSGCVPYGGTLNFSGPGSFQDFANARYQCFSALGGVSTVSCGAMDSCMASKGYIRDRNGRHDASSIQVQCND